MSGVLAGGGVDLFGENVRLVSIARQQWLLMRRVGIMAQAIILRELEITESVEHVAAVKNSIANFQDLMGESITEEIGNAVSALLVSAFSVGYDQGDDTELRESLRHLLDLLGEGLTEEIGNAVSGLWVSAVAAGCSQGSIDSEY